MLRRVIENCLDIEELEAAIGCLGHIPFGPADKLKVTTLRGSGATLRISHFYLEPLFATATSLETLVTPDYHCGAHL